FADSKSYPFWEHAAAKNIPVCMQMKQEGIPLLRQIMDKFPKVTILLDHLSRTPFEDGPPYAGAADFLALAKYKQVYLKITPINVTPKTWGKGTPETFFGKVIDAFGAERIGWGSNFPNSIGTMKEILTAAQKAFSFAKSSDQDWIFGKTELSIYPRLKDCSHDVDMRRQKDAEDADRDVPAHRAPEIRRAALGPSGFRVHGDRPGLGRLQGHDPGRQVRRLGNGDRHLSARQGARQAACASARGDDRPLPASLCDLQRQQGADDPRRSQRQARRHPLVHHDHRRLDPRYPGQRLRCRPRQHRMGNLRGAARRGVQGHHAARAEGKKDRTDAARRRARRGARRVVR